MLNTEINIVTFVNSQVYHWNSLYHINVNLPPFFQLSFFNFAIHVHP